MDAVEPVEVTAGGHLTDTGVEDWAVASLLFAGGFTANVRAGTRLADDMQAHIYGSEGHLRIPNPWTPGKDGNEPTVMLSRLGDDEPRILPIASAPLFGAEIDALWEARDSGEARAMSPRDSVATMRSLDRWRGGVGVR
jgi:predicted dehydrogenase